MTMTMTMTKNKIQNRSFRGRILTKVLFISVEGFSNSPHTAKNDFIMHEKCSHSMDNCFIFKKMNEN